jgi:hypothetical protein
MSEALPHEGQKRFEESRQSLSMCQWCSAIAEDYQPNSCDQKGNNGIKRSCAVRRCSERQTTIGHNHSLETRMAPQHKALDLLDPFPAFTNQTQTHSKQDVLHGVISRETCCSKRTRLGTFTLVRQ